MKISRRRGWHRATRSCAFSVSSAASRKEYVATRAPTRRQSVVGDVPMLPPNVLLYVVSSETKRIVIVSKGAKQSGSTGAPGRRNTHNSILERRESTQGLHFCGAHGATHAHTCTRAPW